MVRDQEFIELQSQVIILAKQLDMVVTLAQNMTKALHLITSIVKDHERRLDGLDGTTLDRQPNTAA